MKRIRFRDLKFVILQFLLIIGYFIPIDYIYFEYEPMYIYGGLIAFILGCLLIIIAVFQLGRNFTILPAPIHGKKLIRTGIYKYIRHPINTGIMFITLGLAFYTLEYWKLGFSILIWAFHYFYADYEDLLLNRQYVYFEDYKKKTNSFFPKIKSFM
jgi:protein-S-isoprenylcysteine O-methyltransferase Ste14